jgi:hypothetical protein
MGNEEWRDRRADAWSRGGQEPDSMNLTAVCFDWIDHVLPFRHVLLFADGISLSDRPMLGPLRRIQVVNDVVSVSSVQGRRRKSYFCRTSSYQGEKPLRKSFKNQRENITAQ